ncbi:M20 family metallopeptidase [Marinilactibacillus sp. Marseille-P9653]|uniref:M20 family metallopeptidase n=1 Tax=Marinilactibacillus sp. Marseille-P9653 TaxID=2866583 RepID=UPI001CE3CA5F|nr:M20 family metallopeptidase [Marinilactibacillus sp. Marseille-P9653]
MTNYITEQIKKESLVALKRLVDIPSYLEPADSSKPSKPFGEGVDQVLKEALALCKTFGMETFCDPNGYYGYADYGNGEETVGILCHLDVVPEGDRSKWETDPFDATEKGSVLYGRGTQDDKGPTISALYAFKALVDAGVPFNRKIRFVFGTDEENLWRCMEAYKQHEKMPDMGFVPDSAFPLTYAEKGLMQFKLTGPGSESLELNCSGALNVVPAVATYRGEQQAELAEILKQQNFPYEQTEEEIVTYGKAVHASTAFEGANAITRLVEGLATLQSHPMLSFIAEKIGQETNGYRIFGEIEDEMTGELTFNVASLEINKQRSEVMVDMRIPVSYNQEDLVKILEEVTTEYGLTYQMYDALPSLYVPKDSPLVETLMTIYRDKTGDMQEPLTSGGATYARSMPNMVAFGAHFPGSPSLAHQENEGIILKEFYLAMEIYAEAIHQLCCQ